MYGFATYPLSRVIAFAKHLTWLAVKKKKKMKKRKNSAREASRGHARRFDFVICARCDAYMIDAADGYDGMRAW